MARSSDESESDEELEQGAIVLHQLFNRKVVLYPDNTVVKSGKRIAIGEADALKVAEAAGIPAPAVHDAHTDSDGVKHIRMSYIEGETLDKLWPDLPAEKKNILVHDGKVKGIIDWEDSGWYPAYWEFVKFFLRPAERGWKEYAEEIFPELYQDELVDLIAISKWQND
ncbi:phosphotransferase enzyme family domain-containing protein [Purpureocillium lilacinum]|uniref:Phosphotransferase enzyme family domain-containing protein n=1 Tax=Purpureocillium lilacinum TaxID=33203 RepID=A0A179GR06_PURLI|nr:phosphotransferase enzyme family domain-containing protein [Purpureocillium lilacinum]OAQ79569.1 phosphotransferase enzyme family domain-containing protein [Purpureocillium lilacinum]OAQ89034.1 phosphotransferase enzyme family domain-containing protein [Purpureocillium lilacinum]